jgi:cytochrome c biogenesis protein CcdA/thiol-disulfide isomerase/thioredoxin
VLVLLLVAFVAGIVTALSPCVLPVLPVILAGGTTGSERRPYAIVAGLVTSFTVFTLTATALLSALHLPDDLLRNLAIVVVALVGLSLLWPRLGDLLERPFARLSRRSSRDLGGGFLLGVSLGLVFTPCAGPVIGAVATVAATQRLSFDAVLVTLAYALGAGLVLLGIAIAGRRGLALPRFRSAAPTIRRVLGAAVLAVAVLMAFNVDTRLRTNLPEYTRALQRLEKSSDVQDRLDDFVPARGTVIAEEGELSDRGPAPEFAGIEGWINSPPLTIEGLRGKVVLIDFWTYSCINCLRTLPYLKQWDETYRDKGLVIVGVHTPEFAFEHERSNVEDAVKRLGLAYPVALDPDFGTWEAWSNRYWPAKYLIDRAGRVRFAHFGEGDYEKTEKAIRTLLAEPDLPALVSNDVDAEAPGDVQTPETYLGSERLAGYYGSPITVGREVDYAFAEALPANGVSYAGRWTVEGERIVAGADARLRLRYWAGNANLVLGTSGKSGTVDVLLDGKPVKTVTVDKDDLYRLTDLPTAGEHLLELRFSPGVEAYAFTFG